MNQNELQNDANQGTEANSGLTDLAPIGDVKGGPATNTYTGLTTVNEGTLNNTGPSGSNTWQGPILLNNNHSETTVEDEADNDEAGSTQLADLTVHDDEQAEAIVGGGLTGNRIAPPFTS